MKPKFKIGDKVLCIDTNFSYGRTKAVDDHAFGMIRQFPELLKVYTVRSCPPNRTGILLCEVINPILINEKGEHMEELHWNDWRFIKVKKEIIQNSEKASKANVIQLDLFEEVIVIEESEILETLK
jgi:hypothetical protein